MHTANNAAERAHWEVLWISGREIETEPFLDDFAGALASMHEKTRANLIDELKQKKDPEHRLRFKGLTLRCTNMQFPPPTFLDKDTIAEHNARGSGWCPYCVKMRRFVKSTKNRKIDNDNREPSVVCMACGVGLNVVSKWNPGAGVWLSGGRVKDPQGKANAAKRARARRAAQEDAE